MRFVDLENPHFHRLGKYVWLFNFLVIRLSHNHVKQPNLVFGNQITIL